jgi:hypothetical protein
MKIGAFQFAVKGDIRQNFERMEKASLEGAQILLLIW